MSPIEAVLKEIADLEEMIRNADPGETLSEEVNRVESLRKRLADAKRALDNIQKLPKAVKAAETGQKVITATRTGGVLTRAFTAIGRAIGFGSGTAATVAGVVLTTVVLAGITYGAANYLGSRAGDTPVQLGPRAASPASTAVQAPAVQGAGPYYIFSINASGPNIYIGSKSDVAKQSCVFVDGGNACQPGDANVQVLETLGGPYDSLAQATAAYCGMVTNVRSYFGGYKGTINGKDYWLDNAPSC